ncbi:hypothetical protein LLH06_15695 [Mucilaginibacter daejeonensis]|uniref:hypothetical protein n=1 Tax=Mucilaginibacter daejeonensis TaxID=398049 RepID=UPI001D175A2F|nr:hypothetical protein [Mucilaginibacter daejeonensis]UEG52401.1 hypothetical protein LLH06_15695 [Mucilaginibacter daejeonensis]
MTLARNHRLLLSGNKKLWLLALVIISACSPKVRTVGRTGPSANGTPTQPVKPQATTPATTKPATTVEHARVSNISLLLPFGLDNLNSVKGYNAADLKKANIAVDYYQGFKLALDSLTAKGYNYKLQVFDTRDELAYTHSLSVNPSVRSSALIVGPVFPEGLKTFIGTPASLTRPLVSPLSPASPDDLHSDKLITVMPPLEYHAAAAAKFVHTRVKPRKVFILLSGFSEDKKFITPFKHSMDTVSKRKVQVVYFIVSHGSLTKLLPQLNNKVENVFIVPAQNKSFLTVTLRSLDTLSRHYPVTTIGHPNWEKLTFLKADILQRIKAHITSSDRVSYRQSATTAFIRSYRRFYGSEPSAYAYKGFDEAMYFGGLVAQEGDALSHLDQYPYQALHNRFDFVRRPGLGWINAHVNVLKYTNFELKQVQ